MNGIITFINEACDPEAGTMLRPWSQTCRLQNWEQDISVALKPPVHLLLQQLDVLPVAISGGFHFLYIRAELTAWDSGGRGTVVW